MTEIPRHLRKRAEEARNRAETSDVDGRGSVCATRSESTPQDARLPIDLDSHESIRCEFKTLASGRVCWRVSVHNEDKNNWTVGGQAVVDTHDEARIQAEALFLHYEEKLALETHDGWNRFSPQDAVRR